MEEVKPKVEKYYLFGMRNIRWGIKELIKMYSNQPSFFSHKRFQTGLAFIIFCEGAMFTLTRYVSSVGDFIMWAAPVLLIAGYTLNQTQKEKKEEQQNTEQ